MIAHTPGPWWWEGEPGMSSLRCGAAESGSSVISHADYEGLYFSGGNGGHGEDEANARLIAAAPDMLSVLKRIHANGYDSMADFDIVRNVIAQATGETK